MVRYIDLQLTRRFKKLQEPYQRAAEAIDEAARRAHAKPFAELAMEQQTALLAALDAGKGDKALWGQDGGKDAFEMVLAHTMQGFYGKPAPWRQPRLRVWRLVGVPPMPVRGRPTTASRRTADGARQSERRDYRRRRRRPIVAKELAVAGFTWSCWSAAS